MVMSKSTRLNEAEGLVGSKPIGKGSPRQVLLVDNSVLKRNNLKPGDLRENFVISNLNLLDIKSGSVLQIGSAEIRITFKCEACKHLEKYGAKLNKDIIDNRGLLAIVTKSGVVKVGDRVEDKGVFYVEVPEKFNDRFYWVVSKIPKGRVVDYKTLLTIVGGSSGYMRTFPRLIKKGLKEYPNLPFHRITNSKFEVLGFILDQEAMLKKEGVAMSKFSACVWSPVNLYKY